MDSARLRNIGIIAHIDAGKTTFSERMLYYSDVIHRMGEVHEGAATMDFMPEEQERGITIASACITCNWNNHTINLVDTPGHVDFTVEVERCLRVLDGAVGVFCAVSGVEPQSETVWRQADEFSIPRLAVVNKMDRPGASYAGVLQAIEERLGARTLPVTVPLGEGEEFTAVLDIIRQETVLFDPDDSGRTVTRHPFSTEEARVASPWREKLMDTLTEDDDSLLEAWLSGQTPDPSLLDAAVRKGTVSRKFVPVFAASALHNIGVQPVMDGVCRYLPGPGDMPDAEATIMGQAGAGKEQAMQTAFVKADPSAPVCAFAFKVTVSDSRKIVFLRLYSGTLRQGDSLIDCATGKKERAMRLYRLYADRRDALEEACAGDILAVQGLKDTKTGDTLVSRPPLLMLEPLRTWRPVISLAFEPKNAEEGERLDAALTTFITEDPTLSAESNEGTGQRIVSGMGELHLEVLADRMKREWGITARVGNPQVICRETVTAETLFTAVFDRELGGQQHYGRVSVQVGPGERSTGVVVEVADGTLEAKDWTPAFWEAALQGARDACYSGPHGNEVDDVRITVTGLGRNESGLATPQGIHVAAQQAVRGAMEEAKSVVLEPLMRLVISVPDDFLGSVISLLGTKNGRVENIGERSGLKEVTALAPMRELFGFSTALRSATQGRAGLMMQFMRFDSIR